MGSAPPWAGVTPAPSINRKVARGALLCVFHFHTGCRGHPCRPPRRRLFSRFEWYLFPVRPFFVEVGRVYAPFLIANARALVSGATQVRCEIDGLPWVQQPFPYQGKCLKWMREARAALGADDRKFVDTALESTDAGAIFS